MYTSNTLIPAGIVTSDIEIFYDTSREDVYFFQDGVKQHWTDLPASVKRKVMDLLTEDISRLIRNVFNVHKEADITSVFLKCRFGNLDYVADIASCGKISFDAPHCNQLLKCKGFGKICNVPANLTRMEYIITREVSTGKLIKEIADQMILSEATIRTHIQRVHRKTNCNNNVELSAWAHKLKIV